MEDGRPVLNRRHRSQYGRGWWKEKYNKYHMVVYTQIAMSLQPITCGELLSYFDLTRSEKKHQVHIETDSLCRLFNQHSFLLVHVKSAHWAFLIVHQPFVDTIHMEYVRATKISNFFTRFELTQTHCTSFRLIFRHLHILYKTNLLGTFFDVLWTGTNW